MTSTPGARKKNVATLLVAALRRIQKHRPSFSMRRAAHLLKISPAFLDRILKHKAILPEARLADVARVFQLDSIAQDQLKEALLVEKMKKSKLIQNRLSQSDQANRKDSISPTTPGTATDFVETNREDRRLLEKWYYLALLDLVGSENFVPEVNWIDQRLGLSLAVAVEAVRTLFAAQYLTKDGTGRWVKSHQLLRFPTTSSDPFVRGFHQQILQKAHRSLELEISEENFQSRLIAGVTFTADPQKLDEAKKILNSALYQIADLMRGGSCTEVYQVSGLLFPLTKKHKKTKT